MNIEQGLTQYIQGDASVSSIALVGGFYAQLPKDQTLPSWSYLFVSDVPTYTLTGADPLTMRRLQIDCYGNTGANAIQLAAAIDALLSGYAGTLPNGTKVQGCFRTGLIDFLR